MQGKESLPASPFRPGPAAPSESTRQHTLGENLSSRRSSAMPDDNEEQGVNPVRLTPCCEQRQRRFWRNERRGREIDA